MISALILSICALSGAEPVAWDELSLSIRRDPYVSSDTATLCRVRVENHGRRTWQGRDLRFEARAFAEGRMAARRLGRFGLTLGPHESLETVVGFVGLFDRFEVVAASGGRGRPPESRTRSRRGTGKRKGKR